MQTFLKISWSISRGRDTYGYNICRLDHTRTGKRYRCSGGGYDMIGTTLADWLEVAFQDRLKELDLTPDPSSSRRRHYGAYHRKDGWVGLNGACGVESIRSIGQAVGVELKAKGDRKGRTQGYWASWDDVSP